MCGQQKADNRKIAPPELPLAGKQVSGHQQVLIGIGVAMITLGGGYLLYIYSFGPFWAWLSVGFGVVILLRGWNPAWFIKHVEAQLISGIPARDKVSWKVWTLSLSMAFLFALSARLIQQSLRPKPLPPSSPMTEPESPHIQPDARVIEEERQSDIAEAEAARKARDAVRDSLERMRSSEGQVATRVLTLTVLPANTPLKERALLLSGDILEFLVGRNENAPPYPEVKTWAQDQAIVRAYDAETMRLFTQSFAPNIYSVRDALTLKGLRDPGLDQLYEHPANAYGMRVIAQKIADLAQRLPSPTAAPKAPAAVPAEPKAKLLMEKAYVLKLQNKITNKMGLAVTFFLENFGSEAAFGEVHNSSFVVTPNELPRDKLMGYMQELVAFDPTEDLGKNTDPIYPHVPGQFFSIPSNDRSMDQLSKAYDDFMAGKAILYFFVVIKYRDQSVNSPFIGVSETCGWFNKDSLDVVHNCGINHLSFEVRH